MHLFLPLWPIFSLIFILCGGPLPGRRNHLEGRPGQQDGILLWARLGGSSSEQYIVKLKMQTCCLIKAEFPLLSHLHGVIRLRVEDSALTGFDDGPIPPQLGHSKLIFASEYSHEQI